LALKGDIDSGLILIGKAASRINVIPTCQQLFERIVTEARVIIDLVKDKINIK
jgi:hypothetical protein